MLRGSTVPKATGGSDDAVVIEHTHSASQVAHSHDLKALEGQYTIGTETFDFLKTTNPDKSALVVSEQPEITVQNAGVSGVNKNLPAYIAYIPIIRMS